MQPAIIHAGVLAVVIHSQEVYPDFSASDPVGVVWPGLGRHARISSGARRSPRLSGGRARRRAALQRRDPTGGRRLPRRHRRRRPFPHSRRRARRYVLNVSTVGYRLIKRPFHLDAGEAKDFEVILSPDTFRQTDSVEVTAPARSKPRARTAPPPWFCPATTPRTWPACWRTTRCAPCRASRRQLQRRFRRALLAARGRLQPHRPVLRRHAAAHAFPHHRGHRATGSATAFNGDMVEELELHEGAWPVRFQDRTGGVLDIHTRDGSRTGDSFRIAASPSNAGVMAEGPLGRTSAVPGSSARARAICSTSSSAPEAIRSGVRHGGRPGAPRLRSHSPTASASMSSKATPTSTARQAKAVWASIPSWRPDTTLLSGTWPGARRPPPRCSSSTTPPGCARSSITPTLPTSRWPAGTTASGWGFLGHLDVEPRPPRSMRMSVRRLHDSGFSNQLLSAAPFVGCSITMTARPCTTAVMRSSPGLWPTAIFT